MQSMLTLFHITQNEGKFFFFHVLARCKTLKKKKINKLILQNCTLLHFFLTLIFLSDWKKINNESVCY